MSLEKEEEDASLDKRQQTYIILDGKKYYCMSYEDGCTCQLLLCRNRRTCGRCSLIGDGGKHWKDAKTGVDCECDSKAEKNKKND